MLKWQKIHNRWTKKKNQKQINNTENEYEKETGDRESNKPPA